MKISRKKRELHTSPENKIFNLPENFTGIAIAKGHAMRIELLILFVALTEMLTARAQVNYALVTNTDGSVTASVANNYYASGDIVISNTYEGYPVTSVGEGAFYEGSMTSVTLPNSLMDVGDFAFYYCTRLTNIIIPDSVTNIGRQAFYYCTRLANVSIGTNVTSIGHDAFCACALTNVVIPGSVTNWSDGVFSLCTNLTAITIPSNVTTIGDWAFAFCHLTNIIFLGNAPAGGNNAFSGNPATEVYYYYGTSGWTRWYGGLPTVELGIPPGLVYTSYTEPVTIIGYTGTNGTLTIAPVINGFPVVRIAGFAFQDSTNLTNVTILDGPTNIGQFAFFNCANLASITIPDSVTNIDDDAFAFCTSLTNIVIPDSITSISGWTFYHCTNLTSIILPNSVTSIGNNAFALCINLTNVVVGNGITYIDDHAFAGDSYTNHLVFTFLGNAPTLGDFVFQDDISFGYYGTIICYYDGAIGWGATYGGMPTVELAWTPQIVGSGKVQSGNVVFNIIGTNGMPFVIETSTNLVDWQPIWTNTLSYSPSFRDPLPTFTDSQWTNHPARFYRVR